MCGATGAQNAIQTQQANFSQQLTQQAGQVFGNSSQVFSDLTGALAPTLAAGPSQEGFSAAEKSALDSAAITNTGNAYRNAKAAAIDANSALQPAGGNDADVTGGNMTAIDLRTANAMAGQTASELSGINLADYQQGQQNYNAAVQGLQNAPGVFNTASGSDSAATQSQSGAADTANQIANQQNSWVQGVTGALGAIGGAVATGGMSMIGSGASSALAGLGSGDQGQMSINPTTASSNELL